MVGGARTLALALATLASVAHTATSGWTVEGMCRDGHAQGPYRLRGDDGQLRISGAFNEGTRTGSFIFWRENGVREAHVPYDDRGLRNGTVAAWYDGPPGREPPRHFESAWRHGRRDGETRSWYPDGRLRSLTGYQDGTLLQSTAWSERGREVSRQAAREIAMRDAREADAEYAVRDALVRAHMPECSR